MSDAAVPDAVVLDDVHVVRGGRTVWSDGLVHRAAGRRRGRHRAERLRQDDAAPAPARPARRRRRARSRCSGARPTAGNPRIGYVPQNYTAALGDAIRCRDLVDARAHRGALGPAAAVGAASAAGSTTASTRSAPASYADRRMSELSGGQQQRVAIAQALVDDPDLLLLDEPLANLDVRNQQEIVELLGRAARATRRTILVVAHDLNPLLSVLTGAIYLLDGHPHYDPIGDVVDEDLLTHLYGTPVRVVRTAQGDLFTRGRRDRRRPMLSCADVGFQSNWFDVLQTPFMRNALHRRLAGRARRRAARLLRRSPGRTPSPRTRWPTSAFPAPPARSWSASRSRSAWPSSASAAGCHRRARQAGRRPRDRDRHDPRLRHRRSACCSPRWRSRERRTVTNVLFGNLLAISTGQLLVFAVFTVGRRRGPRRRRPAADLRLGRPAGRRGARACRCARSASRSSCCWRSSITMAVQVVGTLLLFALVVTPAATALADHRPAGRRSPRSASAIALASVWGGLVLVGDVQPAAELLHRLAVVRRLARRGGVGSAASCGCAEAGTAN